MAKRKTLAQQYISIHALVKRATRAAQQNYHGVNISIHALVKRATLALKDTSKKYVYFNPRPREEGDARHTNVIIYHVISIHALVKRATYS